MIAKTHTTNRARDRPTFCLTIHSPSAHMHLHRRLLLPGRAGSHERDGQTATQWSLQVQRPYTQQWTRTQWHQQVLSSGARLSGDGVQHHRHLRDLRRRADVHRPEGRIVPIVRLPIAQSLRIKVNVYIATGQVSKLIKQTTTRNYCCHKMSIRSFCSLINDQAWTAWHTHFSRSRRHNFPICK